VPLDEINLLTNVRGGRVEIRAEGNRLQITNFVAG